MHTANTAAMPPTVPPCMPPRVSAGEPGQLSYCTRYGEFSHATSFDVVSKNSCSSQAFRTRFDDRTHQARLPKVQDRHIPKSTLQKLINKT